MDEKVVSYFLKFLPDDAAQAKTSASVKALVKQLGDLETQAKDLKTQLKNALSTGADTSKLTSDLKQVETSIGSIQAKAQAAAKSASLQQLKEAVQNSQQTAERLERVGMRIGVAGALILGGMTVAAQKYADTMKNTTAASAAWNATSDRLQAAQLKLGSASAKALQPWRDALAGIEETIANIADQSPALGSVLALVGVGATGAGGLLAGAGQVIKVAADVKMLTASTMMNAAADKMLAAAGLQSKSAVAGGGGLLGGLGGILGKVFAVGGGIAIGDQISKALGNMGLGEFLGKGAAITGGGLVSLLTGDSAKGQKAFMDIAQSLGQLGDTAEKTAVKLNISDEQLASMSKAFVQYKTEEAQAEQDFQKQKARSISDFNRSENEAQQSFLKDQATAASSYRDGERQAEQAHLRERQQAMRDYIQADQQAEQDHYLERSKAARNYSTEVARAEEDFQREQSRRREDYQLQLNDVVASGDAFALARVMQGYEIDRRRAQEDYGTSSGRGSQDFNIQQADSEAQFQLDKDRRGQDYSTQQADSQAQFELDRQQKSDEFVQQTKDRNDQFTEERKQSKVNFDRQMTDMDTQFNTELTKRHDQIVLMYQDELGLIDWKHQAEMEGLKGMIDAIKLGMPGGSAPTQGSRASGGYVSPGMWQMHANEFVLNARTTRAAEAAAGRRLDQTTLMRMLGSGGGSVTWNDQRRFDSSLSAGQRREINQDTEELLGSILG